MNLTKATVLSASLAICASLSARTVENVKITLTDGTEVTYSAADVAKISFTSEELAYGFAVTPAEGEEVTLSTLTAMFRYVPEADGERRAFAFGSNPEAESVEDLTAGSYAALVEIAPTSLYTGTIDLVGENAPASVTLYAYDAEGALTSTLAEIKEGTLSTTLNAKNKKVTLTLACTFADGTTLEATYSGIPTDVTSVGALDPVPAFKDAIAYYNADGDQTFTAAVTGVTQATKSNKQRFTFSFDKEAQTCYLEIKPEFYGKKIDLSEATTASNYMNFTYGSIQISDTYNTEYRNQGVKGTILVTENGDGSFTFDIDITNQYKSMWGSGLSGTPERVVLNYTGKP